MKKYDFTIREMENCLKKIESFYNTINDLTKEEIGKETPRRAYIHEMTSTIGSIKEALENYHSGDLTKEQINPIFNSVQSQLKKGNLLEKILGLKDFAKEEIVSSRPYSIKKIALDEQTAHSYELARSNIKTIIEGNSQIYLKPEAIATFLSTNFGNAAKWAPNNTGIYLKLNEENNKVIINLENEFGKGPKREIGEGKGIGTVLTNKIISEIGGTKEFYNKPKISLTDNEVWGIEFTLPKNPNLIN